MMPVTLPELNALKKHCTIKNDKSHTSSLIFNFSTVRMTLNNN